MSALPLVARLVLTFMVAALATLVSIVDDETVRVICAPIIAGLAAIGIVPPQVPTRTVVARASDAVRVVPKAEDGYANNGLLAVVVVVILTIVAVHFLGIWGLLVLLLLLLLLA